MVWFAFAWMILGLLPYSFLTYMLQVPSRHTYVASAGLALLAGTAAYRLSLENRPKLLGTLVIAALIVNIEIVWVKKMSQFLEARRAIGTANKDRRRSYRSRLCRLHTARRVYDGLGASDAGAQPVMRNRRAQGDPHCFSVEYIDHTGEHIRLDRQMGTQKHGTFY